MRFSRSEQRCFSSVAHFSSKTRTMVKCNKENRYNKTNNNTSGHYLVNKQWIDVRMHNFHTSGSLLGKIVPFKLADIGEGIKEVELVTWHVKEGDKINEFDLVAEVKSDKANVEITSRYSGIVKKLYHKVGSTALVGDPLIDIEIQDGSAAEDQHPISKAEAVMPETPAKSHVGADHEVERSIHKVLTTPAVRRIAREHAIDLTKVPATGPKGRVLKEDVLNFIKGGETAVKKPLPTITTTAAAAVTPGPPVFVQEDRVEPVKGIKKAMIKTMNAANAIPHFGLCDDVRVDELVELRKQMKPYADQYQVKLTFMPFIIKAISLALRQYPILNSTLSADETQIIYKAAHNIGVAMDTPEGLLVPIIKNVQNLSIMEIARELNRLQDLGAKGKLGQKDLSDGTFSVSNIGTIGGTYASPLLPPGNVCIGAIGKIQKTPVFDEKDNVIAAQIMNVSWSADHRIIDGATLARFSKLWKQYLEKPSTMLLEMH
jgi:2-oxoisovalerate dehydrogenase E2 component (dihydrolipoyl transacylase)